MEKHGSVLNMVTVDSLVNAGAHYGHHKRYAVGLFFKGSSLFPPKATLAIHEEEVKHDRLCFMPHFCRIRHLSIWNPKMEPYLYGVREDIHIFDLEQTVCW